MMNEEFQWNSMSAIRKTSKILLGFKTNLFPTSQGYRGNQSDEDCKRGDYSAFMLPKDFFVLG